MENGLPDRTEPATAEHAAQAQAQATPGIGHASSREERLQRIARYLEILPPPAREVLFLAYVVRIPIAAIARRTRRSPGAVIALLEQVLTGIPDAAGDAAAPA